VRAPRLPNPLGASLPAHDANDFSTHLIKWHRKNGSLDMLSKHRRPGNNDHNSELPLKTEEQSNGSNAT
jgi:hypothetical protein